MSLKRLKQEIVEELKNEVYNIIEEALTEESNTVKIDKIFDMADEMIKKDKSLRHGQALMIALNKIDKKLYDKITGSKTDPFAGDKNIPAFKEELEKYFK